MSFEGGYGKAKHEAVLPGNETLPIRSRIEQDNSERIEDDSVAFVSKEEIGEKKTAPDGAVVERVVRYAEDRDGKEEKKESESAPESREERLKNFILKRKAELSKDLRESGMGEIAQSIYRRTSAGLNAAAMFGFLALSVTLSSGQQTREISAPEHVAHTQQYHFEPFTFDKTGPHKAIGVGGFSALVQMPELQSAGLKKLKPRALEQLASVLKEVFADPNHWQKLAPGAKKPGVFADTGALNLNVLLDPDISKAIDAKIAEGALGTTKTLANHMPPTFRDLLNRNEH